MRQLFWNLLGVLLALAFSKISLCQQQCASAIPVCTSSFSQTESFVGVGGTQEIPIGSSCLANGEVNSVWYTFTATSTGALLFQLEPLSINDDYDFALYDLTNSSCADIASGNNVPVSCNYSASPGLTGLSTSGIGFSNGSSGPNQNEPLAVVAGETYTLMIGNFTSSQTGYSLNFSGSASIVDNLTGVPDSISFEGVCNPKSIRVFLSEPVNCSSLSTNGSEFTVTGPSAVTVVSASSVNCAGGRTRIFTVNFSDNIQASGVYTLTVNSGTDGDSFTDACGNEMPSGTTIEFEVVFIGPTVTTANVVNVDCGQENGSVEAVVTNGTEPITYNWYNASPPQSSPVATDLGPGTYWVRVTDANGCVARASATITNTSPIILNNVTTNITSCFGSNDGSAELIPSGGSPPFTVTWQTNPTQTGTTAINLSAGNVTVTVVDGLGCEEDTTISIPQPPQINLPSSVVNPDCGLANGAATINAFGGNGGFTYSWNTVPIQTTATATNLMAGIYQVTGTDQNGCSATTSVVLTDNFAPNATIESRVPDCGQGVGQATAIATSGVSPYQYSWSTNPPQNTATATGLSEGDYYVTVTDANNCVQIINVKIDSVPPPSISLDPVPSDCGQTNGEAIASTTDGIAPYAYTWSSSSNTTGTETGLGTGSYTVTVTDSIGCTTSEPFEITQLDPESDFLFSDVCDGDEMSFETETTSGATVWQWDFGDGNSSDQENPTHTYSAPGEYQVTLILQGGCQNDTVVRTVTVFDPPTASFVMDPDIVSTRTPATFIYNGSGGTTFLWDFGDGSEVNQENSPTHLYGVDGFYTASLTTTDANGCVDTTSLTFEVLLQPVIYLPNAFLPEGTPENSRFRGYGIGVIDAELIVFDRWGTVLFLGDNLNDVMNSGWDGTYKGKPVRQGVYAYKIKSDFYNNTSFEKIGTVTLIR
jgi:gliding motility-associated-like protein